MYTLLIVQRLETKDHLVENGPNISFFSKPCCFLGIINFGLQIAIVTKFHDDAETAGALLEESFFVTGNIDMADGR